MGRVDDLLSAEFAAWEQRGRGWQVWLEPVRPEPPFNEFSGYRLPEAELEVDDGRRPTFLASIFDAFEKKLTSSAPPPVNESGEDEPQPGVPLDVEFAVSLPRELEIPDETTRAFLSSLTVCQNPVGFEVLGTGQDISIRFTASASDAHVLERQLTAFFPLLSFTQTGGTLNEVWDTRDGAALIVDFGLSQEFMLPLVTKQSVDPFVAFMASLNELNEDEVAVLQVLFEPTSNPWSGSIWRSVTDANGKALFVNKLQLIPGTKQKLEAPLFGVVLRCAAKAPTFTRVSEIIRGMAYALRSYARSDGNHLIPLNNDEYAFEAHEEDLINRQSRRSGMLLNRDELLGFVHFPSDEVRTPRLARQRTRTKAAPVSSPAGILLGHNNHAGKTAEVRLSTEQRMQHIHVIGASGTGKSTLLFNLIHQDIANGQGVAVIDPHGDLVNRILGSIPQNRIGDVVLFDPTDEEFSVGFNILAAHSDVEKTLLASDLVSVFRRLSSSWGDQLNSVLNNAILAFLESNRGGTLSDLQRFLIDASYRNEFLESVHDPDIVYYWRKAFPQLGGNKSIGSVLTRLNEFLIPKPIRYMVSQRENKVDLNHVMDQRKILLARLSKGLIGDKNAFLLGSLLVSKFQQLAMSRQRVAAENRRDFWLYLDEFQNFITPSMAEILTGTRKYHLGLVLAHHYLSQLREDSDVASAVMTNPYTRVCFRVGSDDARKLADTFASFDADDLQNLRRGEAVVRVERRDQDFNLTVPLPPLPGKDALAVQARVIEASRMKYGTSRTEIEANRSWVAKPESEVVPLQQQQSAGVDAKSKQLSQTKHESPPSSDELDSNPEERAHETLKKRIRSAAEMFGFKATPEHKLASGRRIDVVLKNEKLRIACELSRTTGAEWELGNVEKCFEEVFDYVVAISLTTDQSIKIREKVLQSLKEDQSARVLFKQPDEFIAWLQKKAGPPPHRRPKGDKRDFDSVPSFSDEERQQVEAEFLETIRRFMSDSDNPS